MHQLQASSKKSCFCGLRKLSVFPISLRPWPRRSAVMLHGSEIVSFVETCPGVSPDSGKCKRRYPQQQDTARRFNNSFLHTSLSALPAALCQPQDDKNLVPHVFCSSWSRNLRNPIETRNLRNLRNRQNPSKPGTPKPSKPQPLSEPRNHRNTEAPKPAKPRQLSKPGERNLLNLEPSQDLTIENRNQFLEPVPEPSRNRPSWNLCCAKTP